MADLPRAEGPRITLRALEPIDVDTLYRWENDTRIWEAGSTIAPFSRKQLWDYINSYDADIYAARQLRLMIDITATRDTIGTLDLYDFDPANSRCAVGIFVDTPWQGQGYAREALDTVAAHLRRHLSLHQLYAIVAEANDTSRRLFLAAGYTPAATLADWLRHSGAYTPAILYQKLLT